MKATAPSSADQRRASRGVAVIAIAGMLAPWIAGCQSSCPTAQEDGALVADGPGLSIREPAGETNAVAWPFGYSVREGNGPRELVDLFGNVKAREGDHVQVTGALGPDDIWHVCGEIQVVPS
jgi:hypothetical protein